MAIVVGSLIALLGACALIVRSERVQTAIVSVITDEISQTLHVEAKIERVRLRLPLSIELQGCYLSDQQGRPLLTIPSLRARLSLRALRDDCLRFPEIRLTDPTIQLVQGENNTTNIDFLIKAFQKDQSSQPFAYTIDCQQIVLDNARIRYLHVPSNTDLVLSDVSTRLSLSYSDAQQLEANLQQLHVRAHTSLLDGYVEADLHGSLDTIMADQLQLVYKGEPIFMGQVMVEHPLEKQQMYAVIQCTDLHAKAAMISSLISDIRQEPVDLPEWVYQLGELHYRGGVVGTMDDIALQGSLRTHWGTITTQARLQNKHLLHASVATKHLQVGRYLHISDLGSVSANGVIDMDLHDQSTARLEAHVSSVEYKDYTYTNLSCQGTFSPTECIGTLSMNDPNAIFSANVSLRGIHISPVLEADLRVPHVDLSALHFASEDKGRRLSFRSSMSIQTDTLAEHRADATVGTLRLDSVQIWGEGHRLAIPRIDASMTADGDYRHLKIQSSVLTASADGQFKWSTLVATMQQMLHHNIPSLVEAPKGKHANNTMDFRIELLQADQLLSILSTAPIVFTSSPTIQGYVHEKDGAFSVQVSVPEVINRYKAYRQLSLSIDNQNPQQDIVAAFSGIQHPVSPDSTGLRLGDLTASVQVSANHDSLKTSILFGQVSNIDSIPDILINTTFPKQHGESLVDIHVLPTDFQLGVAGWHVKDSRMQYSRSNHTISVDSLMFTTNQQLLMVDGRMSQSQSDSLRVELRDVDLGYLLSSTKVVDAIDIRGKMTGWLTLYGAFSAPQFEANLSMDHGTINGTDLGRVSASATLDRDAGKVVVQGDVIRDEIKIADINGYVIPTQPATWDIAIDAQGLPLDFINYWTKDIINKVKGDAYGRVHVYGHDWRTWVTTRAFVKDAGVTVPATGARYYFSDTIVMDTASIAFKNIQIHDADGHSGTITGVLKHTNFKNFRFKMDAQCEELLAIDLPASSRNVYYGKAYATGQVSIYGNEKQTTVDVDAATAENTDFYLSLATASSAASSEFITFKSPDALWIDSVDKQPTAKPTSPFLLNLSIDVMPSARVHLVLNEHNGDGIVGRGEGNIRLNMDASSGEMQMVGTYTLRSGTFSYTVGNLVHRDFAIAEGSTVSWLGDAANPKLDIVAKYRCTASLRDLFGADVKQVTSRPSIPVDCVIRITGEMNNMILKFGIEYPQSDESVAAQINAVINTEAMLMRQVIYLLVFNRFYTPEYMRTNAATASLNDAYSLLSSTVTGQINAWLSKLTSMVNVGFNMRYDSQSGNQSYETEANIQIQPIDRLTINGNVGYRYNDLTNQPIFGDADVEYELTADGKFRAKVFTHSVDKYSLHQSGMQEGVGFIFRHDFNPGDAKKRREMKKNKKKAEEK